MTAPPLLATLILAALSAPAFAQTADTPATAPIATTPAEICAAFQRMDDGNWVAMRAFDIAVDNGSTTAVAANGPIEVTGNPSSGVFTPGVYYGGVDIATYLDAHCVKHP